MGVRKAIIEMKLKRRCVIDEQTCPMLGGEKSRGIGDHNRLCVDLQKIDHDKTMCKVDDGVWKVPRRNDQ